jgi:hypothetical protein
VKTQFIAQIEAAERAIQTAGFRSITEIPSIVSSAVTLLESVQSTVQDCPAPERANVLSRLKDFQGKLRVFSLATGRSAHIFRGYSRLAGISFDEYTPGGIAADSRDPAFFSLSF